MFIDYVPLMLINMAAGLIILSLYIVKGIEGADQKIWAGGFLITGAIALINGLHMVWNWPLPGSYNIAFGEMSVLLGFLFFAAGICLAKGLGLFSLAVYSLFAGIAAIVIGLRIANLNLTKEPLGTAMGFILTGLSAVLALPVLYLKKNKALRIIAALFLVIVALIWLRTGYGALWAHLAGSANWKPLIMR